MKKQDQDLSNQSQEPISATVEVGPKRGTNLDAAPPAAKCQGCDKPGTPDLHSCPYQEDINDCADESCNCCEDCTRECAMDI